MRTLISSGDFYPGNPLNIWHSFTTLLENIIKNKETKKEEVWPAPLEGGGFSAGLSNSPPAPEMNRDHTTYKKNEHQLIVSEAYF